MPVKPPYPVLYQSNLRYVLDDLTQSLGRSVTTEDIPDTDLDRMAELGITWIWLLGVWQIGPHARQEALRYDWLRGRFHEALPGYKDADVCGSPFALSGYTVHTDFGGTAALQTLRGRLADRGIKLMLDFVPNHTGRDHPWVDERPEYYIHGSEEDLAREPWNYAKVDTVRGPRILAHGRDPYFPGWTDTFQLNYRHAGLRRAMEEELLKVAGLCDGVRCDMAMLLLPDVFAKTWGHRSTPADGSPPVDEPFWPEAIVRVRASHPSFVFMAEVYWDLEWTLQQLGFDYTYDKRLYDRLRIGDTVGVRSHLRGGLEYQAKLVRFLENHDEQRAVVGFPGEQGKAAAVITYLVPGMRFFHQGQLEGRRIHSVIQLARRQPEGIDPLVKWFYLRLLACLRCRAVQRGTWLLLDCRPAWHDDPSWGSFLAFLWSDEDERVIVVVNYADVQGRCYVTVPDGGFTGKQLELYDLLTDVTYERDGTELLKMGLYADLPPWGAHVFRTSVGG